MIWLVGFPMPPSANTHLKPVRTRKGTTRQVKSDEHRRYLDDCILWSRKLSNRAHFDNATRMIWDLKKEAAQAGRDLTLQVDMIFVFHVERLIAASGSLRQVDADNRVKPCRDALAAILGIDDRHFIAGYFEAATTASKDSECSMIRIQRAGMPRPAELIREAINQGRNPLAKEPLLGF